MFLQSLELLGFKSFAEKTTLNFHPGVTAVVGPNGCGKSNVLDAMRWVLGEQSAKALRGGEMADVIFSGTETRAPLGMAEVSMTFAECEKELGVEWNEVRITRRVFRDGASEYLLNKTPCRLRDIHTLFMDTGIGRSAYSIMEQGKIDLILSSKPEDRRAIFEEAAGITKFKSQRREALRKLEATDANLLRVTDVIKEVKRQIGSLQRQAGKARRYQALLGDLRILETHHARQQFETLDRATRTAAAEIARLQELHATTEAEIETHESDVAAQRHQLTELEQNVNAARHVVQDLKSHVENAEHRVGFNQERIAEFTALADRYARDIAATEEKLRIQQAQIETTELELGHIVETLASEQEQLDEKMRQVNALSAERVARETSVQAVFGEIAKIENRLGSLRGETSSLINQRDGSETRLRILAGEIEHLCAATERFAREKAELINGIAQAGEALNVRGQEVAAADEKVRAISSELVELDQKLAAENRALTEKQSTLEVLTQLNESGEGFTEGTQAVLRGLDNPGFYQPALLGALATHLRVEPDFIPAIEAALGENLQAIVTKDAAVAESILQTLTAQKLGRASLALRERGPSTPAPNDRALPHECLAWAADKVSAAPEVEALVHLLLTDFAIVRDLETALRLSGASAFHFVTLAGEILTREGVLTGGSRTAGTGASVLQRRNRIEQLETETATARTAISKLTKTRDGVVEKLDRSRASLTELREEFQNATAALAASKTQQQAMEREESENAKKAENLGWEGDNIEARHREAVEKLAACDAAQMQASEKLQELQAQQSSLQKELDGLRAAEAERGVELNDLRIKVATEKQRHDSLDHQREPMAARLHELDELIELRRRDIDSYHAKAEGLREESTRIAAEIENTRGKTAEAENRVLSLAEGRGALAASVEALEATLRIMRRQLSDCHDQRSQQEVKQAQVQLRIENLAEHITRRYHLDVREFAADHYALRVALREQKKRARGDAEASAAAPEISDGEESERIDWTHIETLVAELNQRLDSMGPVNVDAIQEFEELEQRHVFLEGQITDLANSKTELLDVIAKINATTRKMFAETFEQVRVNFSEMFVELFGGGKANLLLVDESDPLESGIDIIARPPGKQLQSISLLSGGEKTMTAVALLFAIYMVKPSPFCVLDEMDAPLDESNINRFIKILDRFVSQSQFVVISHNKRTIAKADALYGVTMEDRGVSKLVGVRFAKREESGKRSDIIGTANAAPVPSLAESFGKRGELQSEQLAG